MREIENQFGKYDVTDEEKRILKQFIADNADLDIYYDSYHNSIRGVTGEEFYSDPERYDFITIAFTNFLNTMEEIVKWAYTHNYEISKIINIEGRVCIENTGANQ
jgi:hypothetical protein